MSAMTQDHTGKSELFFHLHSVTNFLTHNPTYFYLSSRSVVGFCASTNRYYTKYFSLVKFQPAGQEVVTALGECMEQALLNWQAINGSFPARVIVYRDGVGEGQFTVIVSFTLFILFPSCDIAHLISTISWMLKSHKFVKHWHKFPLALNCVKLSFKNAFTQEYSKPMNRDRS